jgi:hypothetical protein
MRTRKRALTPDDIPEFYRPYFRRSIRAGVPIAAILAFVTDLEGDMQQWTRDVTRLLKNAKTRRR